MEKKNLLKKINAVSTEIKKLEVIYQQKINDLEELKKSVLQKAFSGGLNYDSSDLNDYGDSDKNQSKQNHHSLK